MQTKIDGLFTLIDELAARDGLVARCLFHSLSSVPKQEWQYAFGLEWNATWKCGFTQDGLLTALLGRGFKEQMSLTLDASGLIEGENENLDLSRSVIDENVKHLYSQDDGAFFVYAFNLGNGFLQRENAGGDKITEIYSGHVFTVIQYYQHNEVRYRLFQSFLNNHFNNKAIGHCHVEGISYTGYSLGDYLRRVKLKKIQGDFNKSEFDHFLSELERFAFSSDCFWDEERESFHQQYFDCASEKLGRFITTRIGLSVSCVRGSVDKTMDLEAQFKATPMPNIKLISLENEERFVDVLKELEGAPPSLSAKPLTCYFFALPPRWHRMFGANILPEKIIQKLLSLAEEDTLESSCSRSM